MKWNPFINSIFLTLTVFTWVINLSTTLSSNISSIKWSHNNWKWADSQSKCCTIASTNPLNPCVGFSPPLGFPLDMLRCESLLGLDQATCSRVLNKNYKLLVSMAPLSNEIRPISSCTPQVRRLQWGRAEGTLRGRLEKWIVCVCVCVLVDR